MDLIDQLKSRKKTLIIVEKKIKEGKPLWKIFQTVVNRYKKE